MEGVWAAANRKNVDERRAVDLAQFSGMYKVDTYTLCRVLQEIGDQKRWTLMDSALRRRLTLHRPFKPEVYIGDQSILEPV